MLKVLLIVIIIVGISVLLLGIKVFFTKNGKFPNTHIGGNKALSKRGISCAKTDDKLAQQKQGLFDRLEDDEIKNNKEKK
ncbi:MAG: hypothetical protein ACRCX4_14095 [Bacteroidales bacterium]